jgi:hypothetical protein
MCKLEDQLKTFHTLVHEAGAEHRADEPWKQNVRGIVDEIEKAIVGKESGHVAVALALAVNGYVDQTMAARADALRELLENPAIKQLLLEAALTQATPKGQPS